MALMIGKIVAVMTMMVVVVVMDIIISSICMIIIAIIIMMVACCMVQVALQLLTLGDSSAVRQPHSSFLNRGLFRVQGSGFFL